MLIITESFLEHRKLFMHHSISMVMLTDYFDSSTHKKSPWILESHEKEVN